MDLQNKTALVTGASGSIGQAVARRLAEAGARVAICYHAGQRSAEQLCSELPGSGHLAIRGDIAQPLDVERMVAEAVGAWHRLDILVNNAAIEQANPVMSTGYSAWQEAWQRVLAVNLFGAANACYCAARHMAGQGGGRIVNVGSRGAYRGEPGHTNYGASKAGLHALSQSLAIALAPQNIIVSAVAPGFVEGGMAESVLAGPRGDAIRAQSPFGRVATPEEVAHAVLFLAAPGSEWLAGAVLDVNGASYLR